MTFCGEEEQGSDAPGGFLCRRQKKTSEQSGLCSDVARQEGLEPPTFWFVAKHSIQLSYWRRSYSPIIIVESRALVKGL